MSQVFERIVSLLDAQGVAYHVVEHPPVYTSQEAAKVRGTPLEQGAKAMLFKADDRPVLLVVAAHHRIDRREFKRLYNECWLIERLRYRALAQAGKMACKPVEKAT